MINWKINQNSVDYKEALSFMEERVQKIQRGEEPELGWILEHPSLFSIGTSGSKGDIFRHDVFPIYETGRGGKVTYHGPGQRIVYLLLNLKKRDVGIKEYVNLLEEWLIQSLKSMGVEAGRRQGLVGIWVLEKDQDKKIASIGVRVQKGVAFHGVALNINPNLHHFSYINPCGLQNNPTTSLQDLGFAISRDEVDTILMQYFQKIF